MMKILAITLCLAVASLKANEGRHHIINRGHLKPPEEPFFTADIEPVEPGLNVAVEKRQEEVEVNQDPYRSDSRGTKVYKMPPPYGPIRDIRKSPGAPLDKEQRQSDSRGATRHNMPPPNFPLRDKKSPREDKVKNTPDEGSGSCGRSSSSSSRVVNGADATLGEWPWQARLQFNQNHLCGGTLIMPEWVMTAAHCVIHNDTNKFKVILGDVDRINTKGSEQEFEVKRIIKHRLFSHPVPYENDIALFQLSHPATLNDFVKTACLPGFLEEVPVGKECYITGWGQMFGEVQQSAPILQQARMPVVSNGACAAKLDTSPNGGLHTDNRTWIVTSKMICAGDAGKTKTHGCFGDSGGPFQCKNTAGQWVVQGIVSWGDPDCSSRYHYAVFTRVSVFREWLDNVISNSESKHD